MNNSFFQAFESYPSKEENVMGNVVIHNLKKARHKSDYKKPTKINISNISVAKNKPRSDDEQDYQSGSLNDEPMGNEEDVKSTDIDKIADDVFNKNESNKLPNEEDSEDVDENTDNPSVGKQGHPGIDEGTS